MNEYTPQIPNLPLEPKKKKMNYERIALVAIVILLLIGAIFYFSSRAINKSINTKLDERYNQAIEDVALEQTRTSSMIYAYTNELNETVLETKTLTEICSGTGSQAKA